MADAKAIFNAFRQKAQFEVVEHTLSENQLRIVGRVPEDSMRVNMNNWLIVVRTLLKAQQANVPWTVDLSKQYFLKGSLDQEKVFFAHRVIFQAPNIAQYFDDIARLVMRTRDTAVAEVTEITLPGAGRDRNDRDARNGRGAAPIKAGR